MWTLAATSSASTWLRILKQINFRPVDHGLASRAVYIDTSYLCRYVGFPYRKFVYITRIVGVKQPKSTQQLIISVHH